MPRDEELPIIRAFYDFVLWLNPKIAKFPRDQRFVLGERMERQLYEVLENLILRQIHAESEGHPGSSESRLGNPAIPDPLGQGSALPVAEKLRHGRRGAYRHRAAGRWLAPAIPDLTT